MVDNIMNPSSLGVVVIGRNEGERLERCLRSLPKNVPAVYVDSGSIDGSVAFAQSMGFFVVDLDIRKPFTAARARNEGWRSLISMFRDLEFIQFLDGDCEVAPGWLEDALAAALNEPDLAAVFGRRRERFPDRSIYNQMCDDEWNVPIGPASSCGGDALFRTKALVQADGYSDDLIAGEEPDLCLRLRQMGWRIMRIDAEMTLHDAAIYKLGSWWKRAERGGFAYAEHVWRHRAKADPLWRRQVFSIVGWTLLLPAAAVLALSSFAISPLVASSIGALAAVGYWLQVIRIAGHKRAKGASWHFALSSGTLIVLGKFAAFSGVVKCWMSHLLRRRQALIEYKVHDEQ